MTKYISMKIVKNNRNRKFSLNKYIRLNRLLKNIRIQSKNIRVQSKYKKNKD